MIVDVAPVTEFMDFLKDFMHCGKPRTEDKLMGCKLAEEFGEKMAMLQIPHLSLLDFAVSGTTS